MKWLGNQIQVDPPKKPKKLTGTRFATVLGLNPWSTPFEIWCAVTRTYEKPFEDTIYTKAGKIIEPKQADYMRDEYWMDNLVRPSDIWGKDYFHKTWGDFFPERGVLGGMWDYILTDKDGKPNTVLEMKTTKRAEDWADDIPEYYALQAALYAHLLGVENVIMVASFLEPEDYEHPENFVCTSDNTITRPFKLHERYPRFSEDYVEPVLDWWNEYVKTGISPEFDEKKDADILKELRTHNVNPESNLNSLIASAEKLKKEIDIIHASAAEREKTYKEITKQIKEMLMDRFRDGDKKVSVSGKDYNWELSKSFTAKIDKKAMEGDGILDKYTYAEPTYRFGPKPIKEDK